MGCMSKTIKYILIIFNVLMLACAIALIAVGGIILTEENKGIPSFTDLSVGGFAIGIGVLIFIIAFFGCFGAIKENSCMLTFYAIILIILLILQLAMGIAAFIQIQDDANDLDGIVESIVKDIFDDFINHQNNADKEDLVDSIQKEFECCGVKNYEYWFQYSLDIPASCYKDQNKNNDYFTRGCAPVFKDLIVDNIAIIGGVAVGFAVVELLGAVFAFVVRKRGLLKKVYV